MIYLHINYKVHIACNLSLIAKMHESQGHRQ